MKLDSKLKGKFPDLDQIRQRAIAKAVPRIKAIAAVLTPKDSGALANSITIEVTAYGVRIRWNEDYAKYVDSGASPHIIRPKGAKVLRFMGSEGIVFAHQVNHPGYPGWNFRADVRRAAKEIIKASILDEIMRSL